MKRILFLSLMFTFLMSSLSLEAQNKKTQKVATTVSNKIEVYYFHYTRRCITCNAVETVTKEAISVSTRAEQEEAMQSLDGAELAVALRKYSDLTNQYEVMGGYEIEEKMSKICAGLKFKETFFATRF